MLNGGEFWVQIDNGELNRQVIVNAAGGTLSGRRRFGHVHADVQRQRSAAAARSSIDNTFGGDGVFTANNTYTAPVRFIGARARTRSQGGFAGASQRPQRGHADPLGAAATTCPTPAQIQMNGGALRLENGGGVHRNGRQHQPAHRHARHRRQQRGGTFNGGALNAQRAGTGLEVRLNALGTSSRVNFTNAAGFEVNGIIPWAYGSADDPFLNGVENDVDRVARAPAPTASRPLSQPGGYLENTFTGAGATTNVRLRAGVNGQPGTTRTTRSPATSRSTR